MNKPLLCSIIALVVLGGGATGDAKPGRDHDRRDRHERYDRHDRHDHRDDRYDRHRHSSHRTRTIYVIENRRPVRRVVYVDPSGYYYRVVSGRRVRVRERYYTSYPSRYFYSDGRPRVGISFSF
ncbi:MAG: hypothetical protein EOP84_29840 [Verrucomicrobiaceae bacterium]|nr:MAG: hypothetical protein EOP84_29840 [Verrucomicrobiaceae bacterium]